MLVNKISVSFYKNRKSQLLIEPDEFIDRVANADGDFKMDAFPVNLKSEQTIKAEIFDAQGNFVKECETSAGINDSPVTLYCKIENPSTWTSETPNLYSVKVSLVDGTETNYQLTEKFGFRTIEIRESDGVYVNGKKMKFKGINRHVFWSETRRCVSPSIDLLDVRLMKEMNLNAVRCAHYPPNKSFLHIFDSLGLYVLGELAGWQNAYDTEVGSKLVRELVIRDVNHPSVIFWSNGNEGGTNTDLDDDFAIYDPSNRPVIHAHHRPDNDYNEIDCNHYENYYSSKKLLEVPLIYMPTELLHGQDDGGMAAGLGNFRELFWNSELLAGLLKASGISVAFSKEYGTIKRIGNDMGLPIPFNNGPVLVSGETELTGIRNFPSTKSHEVGMTYSGDLKKVTWTMYLSGWLEMNYEYRVEGEQYFTGISFDFTESDIIGAKRLGNGPRYV